MTDEERSLDEEGQERRRPRVVDKRVGARGDVASTASNPASAPSTASPAPPPQPASEEARGPGPRTQSSPATGSSGEMWTPSATEAAPAAPETGSRPEQAAPGEPAERVWSPEEEAEMERLARQIAETSSREWVANVAVTLANVAGTKLERGEAAEAQLAIEALAGILERTGHHLGEAERVLRQTLAQLQMAYAQRVAPGNQ